MSGAGAKLRGASLMLPETAALLWNWGFKRRSPLKGPVFKNAVSEVRLGIGDEAGPTRLPCQRIHLEMPLLVIWLQSLSRVQGLI